MAKRSAINGIAAGIAQKFVARGNSIDGYWALGILYLRASGCGSRELTLNLLPSECTNVEFAIRKAQEFRSYLDKRLEKEGLKLEQIHRVTIGLIFGIGDSDDFLTDTFKTHWDGVFRVQGQRYICKVTIIDDLMISREFSVYGWCAKHDPTKEQISHNAKC